ncbi:hypothetical protein MMC07_002840 [Pseudocyphellaria aurata]|nr:hypothetical protein [Pseudocyphellaria aurata]
MINNWIYFDGGEIAYQAGAYDHVNTTSAIDLSKDWTNCTLNLIQSKSPSDAFVLLHDSLWFDQGRNSIYFFGGTRSSATTDWKHLPPLAGSIRGFNLSDDGTAAWYPVMGTDSTTSFPSDIQLIASGESISDGNRAYYLGSFLTSSSTSQSQTSTSGLLTFDFNTLKFANSNDGNHLASQPPENLELTGKIISISTYGDDGILVILPSVRNSAFHNIALYDMKNQGWYSQIASGDIPSPRSHYCAVGIGGDKNNTFEIFIHGGIINDNSGSQAANSDHIYVLSLPSFQWFRASIVSAYSRADHTCHISKNQMILIGGVNPSHWSEDDIDAPAEPWCQAIGVFDLASWRYKDSHEAKANAYETPEFITKYYSTAGSPYPSSWTSAGVKALFEGKSKITSKSSPSGAATPSSPSGAANPSSPSGATNPSSPSGAATPSSRRRRLGHGEVAGIAMGCIAFIVSCAVCGTFTMRHISKKSRLAELSCPPPQMLPAESQRVELSASRRPQELLTENQDRAELPHSNVLFELFAETTTCAELPG